MAAKAVRIENNSIKKELVYIKKKYFPLYLYFFLCTKKIYWKKGKILRLTKTIFNFNHCIFFFSNHVTIFKHDCIYICRYSLFLTVTTFWLSMTLTVHVNSSVVSTSNTSAIALGIPVLKLLLVVFALFIFECCLNIIISFIIYFVIYNYTFYL